jgi:hypothetical protein
MTNTSRGFDLLSARARAALTALGRDFRPTADPGAATIKGDVTGKDGGTEKVYYTADDLRDLAFGLTEVASYLRCRQKDAGR